MSRWKPNAHGRLQEAALELYSERGFEQTTVAEIAKRAGLTERTFFRHFADKREVLFRGSESLEEYLVSALDHAPASLSPIDAIGHALEAVAVHFPDRGSFYRQRLAVISANAELQERERTKLASLATAFAAALQRRGANATHATLAAEMGVAVFRIAFEKWIEESHRDDLAHYMRTSLRELKAVSAGTP